MKFDLNFQKQVIKFRNEFKTYIENELNLYSFIFPLVQSFNNNDNLINFDNKNNFQVYQLIQSFDKYYCQLMSEDHLNEIHSGFYHIYNQYNRDGEINSGNSIVEEVIELCIRVNLINQIDFKKLIGNFQKKILDFFKFNVNNICFKDLKKINNQIVKFNIDDYLYQETHKSKLVNIIFHDYKSLYLPKNNDSIYDMNQSTTLLYWYDLQKDVIPLMSFWLTNNKFINRDGYNSFSFLKIKLNFSKLLMILFNKIEISELTIW